MGEIHQFKANIDSFVLYLFLCFQNILVNMTMMVVMVVVAVVIVLIVMMMVMILRPMVEFVFRIDMHLN